MKEPVYRILLYGPNGLIVSRSFGLIGDEGQKEVQAFDMAAWLMNREKDAAIRKKQMK